MAEITRSWLGAARGGRGLDSGLRPGPSGVRPGSVWASHVPRGGKVDASWSCWATETHLRRIARGALLKAGVDEVHDSLPAMLEAGLRARADCSVVLSVVSLARAFAPGIARFHRCEQHPHRRQLSTAPSSSQPVSCSGAPVVMAWCILALVAPQPAGNGPPSAGVVHTRVQPERADPRTAVDGMPDFRRGWPWSTPPWAPSARRSPPQQR